MYDLVKHCLESINNPRYSLEPSELMSINTCYTMPFKSVKPQYDAPALPTKRLTSHHSFSFLFFIAARIITYLIYLLAFRILIWYCYNYKIYK